MKLLTRLKDCAFDSNIIEGCFSQHGERVSQDAEGAGNTAQFASIKQAKKKSN